MNNEHRHDLNQVADEEALMDAEEIAQAKFDQRKADYLKAYVDKNNKVFGVPEFYLDFDDWAVGVTKPEKDKLRDHLRRGHIMMFQFYAGGLLMEFMDEIAAQAVREDMKNDISG